LVSSWGVGAPCSGERLSLNSAHHQASFLVASTRARYVFEPIAVESLGVFNASARHLLDDLGRRISLNSGEATETSHLYQRILVLVQIFNAVLLHDRFPAVDSTD